MRPLLAVFIPMATIERLPLENNAAVGDPWDRIADAAAAWARDHRISLRDAIVLLPFAQLLPLARRAFARAGGWQPRIETTRTLAASLGPTAAAGRGQISFDAAVDALSAATLLRSRAWGAAWARRDARGFEQAAAAITTTAHALAQAAFALPPGERPTHWVAARDALTPLAGPGATERLLARVALEWAALAPVPATDALFAAPAPSAWIAVQAAGADALTGRLMAASDAPCFVIDTDASRDDPFARLAPQSAPAFALCDDFEHEAQCAAAQVVDHVRRGEVPVALIAQDRVLVRRVRALLEREQVAMLDETGWKLSTTRAAAKVVGLLMAARADAGTDALLDWLKSGTRWAEGEGALAELEAVCRRGQIASVAALDRVTLDAAPARLWAAASAVLTAMAAPQRQPLGAWLATLAQALDRCGALASLQADDAGRQVLAQLRGAGPVSDVAMSADGFRDWVDGLLEQATFVPPGSDDGPVQAVITPLARAMLRPFAAVVLPGADDRHLGAAPAPDALLGDTLAAALGLPTLARRREAELLAFVQVLAARRVTLLRRRLDGSDPLADSPLVERLSLALAAHGALMPPWRDPRIDLALMPTPIHMSAPAAAALLPARLSASACEALRACPYRFFALNLLRLREDDELEREIEKRDYGTWLHAVLFDFHESRDAPSGFDVEVARLKQIADLRREADGVVEADFLPFAASFASFAPRYIAWLHERDAKGARWQRGELTIDTAPAELGGIELRGVIDRIDEVRGGLQLIDYKTGGVAGLKDKVREPLEDTQLAFYAALMRTQSALPLTASYLAVDGTKRLDEVPHPAVEVSAAALLEGLAHDLQRLRTGAGLPALGEGATCEHCAARGVCRRDHWAES
ncbi:MAG: PD-(D/E)XK nuclease family protein [Burkholderiales bacterium]